MGTQVPSGWARRVQERLASTDPAKKKKKRAPKASKEEAPAAEEDAG